MSNDELMTKRERCSVRCPQQNSPDTLYPLGDSGHYSHSLIHHSSDFLLVNLGDSD
jgi:hypothetical protein